MKDREFICLGKILFFWGRELINNQINMIDNEFFSVKMEVIVKEHYILVIVLYCLQGIFI